MTYSRNLALKEGKCHGSLKKRKRQVKKIFFNYYWESMNLFGNRGEESSEETVMSWGGRGQELTEEEVHQRQGRRLAFSPKYVGGLHASTNHCCCFISWFSNILGTFAF